MPYYTEIEIKTRIDGLKEMVLDATETTEVLNQTLFVFAHLASVTPCLHKTFSKGRSLSVQLENTISNWHKKTDALISKVESDSVSYGKALSLLAQLEKRVRIIQTLEKVAKKRIQTLQMYAQHNPDADDSIELSESFSCPFCCFNWHETQSQQTVERSFDSFDSFSTEDAIKSAKYLLFTIEMGETGKNRVFAENKAVDKLNRLCTQIDNVFKSGNAPLDRYSFVGNDFTETCQFYIADLIDAQETNNTNDESFYQSTAARDQYGRDIAYLIGIGVQVLEHHLSLIQNNEQYTTFADYLETSTTEEERIEIEREAELACQAEGE